MTLTHRLLLLVAIALLPAVAIQAYNEFDLRRSRTAEIHDLALRQARQAASELDQLIGGIRNLLTVVGEVPAVRAGDTAACVAFLRDLQFDVPHLLTIAALDLQGRVTCRQELPLPTESFDDRPYFQQAIATGGFVVGEFTFGRAVKQPVLPLAIPLRGPGGRINGVVAAALDLKWLGQYIRSRPLPPGDSLTIADRNGTIIAREPYPERFVGTRIPDEFLQLISAPVAGALELQSQDGTRRMLGYIPAGIGPVPGLYVSAGLGADHAFAAINRATVRGFGLIALGLLAAVAAALLAGRQFFHRPIEALLAVAGRWRAGDYSVRTGLGRHAGEFGILGAEFDRMAAEIEHREVERDRALAESRQSEARLLAVVESLPFEFWVVDRDGRCVLQNAVSRASWGDWMGRRPEETDLPSALADAWLEDSRRALAGEVVHAEQGVRLGAQLRQLEKIVAPIRDGGRVLGAVGLHIDVTARHEAEQRRKLLVDELNHRVRNMLATVGAIARLTLTDGRSIEESRDTLSDRLRALATTYDLLATSDWGSASLKAIAASELERFGPRGRIEGADCLLTPQAAQTFALILHELATNAATHGALSTPEGRVLLSSQITEQAAEGRLSVRWTESGGPRVTARQKRGLGSNLVEEVAARQLQAEVRLDFHEDGLIYALDAPLSAIAAQPSG
jgi:PAS domain S-box-containing protein